jgi:hypothetical protein
VEREAITDSVLKIQSIQASLDQVDDTKIPDLDQVHDCLKNAHGRLRGALRDDAEFAETRHAPPKRH